jgi:hypothetical protein
MSNTNLAVLNNQTALAKPTGGLGIDFSSKLFQLKPATLSINQPNTQAEGAIKGHLRISETGDQFPELFVTLLVMPTERRQWYAGETGQLNRSPENLMCFSNDLVKPDIKAKVPGALKCEGCPKADWTKWRQTKQKADIPPCESFIYALLIDTKYKMPLQYYVRSKAKQPFEAGMKNLARKLYMMQQQGLNPNLFDVGFKLSTKRVQNGQTVSWVPELSDFRIISDEEREEFGEIYKQFVNRSTKAADQSAEAEAADQIAEVDNVIDAEVVEPNGAGDVVQGEITI